MRIATPAPLGVPALLLFIAGCGSPADATGGGDTVTRDSAGLTVVENLRRAGDRAPRWSLVPEATVGAPEGAAAFGRVSSVDLDREGRLHVLDRLSGTVTVWDTAGRRLRSFGGLGDGPGEFRSPTSVHVLDDGRVAVGEAYPARLHWFDADGSFRRRVRVRPGKGGPPILAVMADWQVTRSGLVRVRLSYMSPSHTEGTPVLVGAVGPGGEVVDTLVTWTSAMTPARLPTIFQAEWSWGLAGEGRLVASPGDRYELRLHDADGELERLVRREAVPVPTTPEMTERAVDRFFERFADADVSAGMLASLRDRLEVAPSLPAVQGLHVAEPSGELWVEVPTPDAAVGTEEPGAYEIFTPGGRLTGRVDVPEGFRLEGIRGGRVHGVWTDELGVEHARVYRVERGPSGS